MKPTTIVQRIAHRVFVSTCCVLFAGVAAAAGVRVAQPKQTAPISIEPENASVQEISSPADRISLAAVDVELLQPISAEPAPARAVSLSSAAKHRPRTIWMEVTAYCPCAECCGAHAHGVTASGKRVSYNHGRFVAADTELLPFGTKLQIPGYSNSRPVEVIDRGGAIEGNRLDVFFKTHQQAMEWGRRWIKVTIVE
jgi:3D (Asp-Asp-Asp) domain-containing protein